MAKATPEGKVKKKLIEFLKSLGSDCFYYMPVQNGMGQTGVPFAFECKATPKQHPTVLQAYALDRIHKARGVAWVVDSDNVDLVKDSVEIIAESIINNAASYDDYIEQLVDTNKESRLYRWKDKLEVMEFEDGTCS